MGRVGRILVIFSAAVGLGLATGAAAGAATTRVLYWGGVPQPVELDEVRAIAAGDNHALAATADGSVYAWGNNTSGQLGRSGSKLSFSEAPLLVEGLGGAAVKVAAGDNFSIALLEDGTVMAWGSDTEGGLGTGSSEFFKSNPTPAKVVGLEHVAGIAASGHKAVALLEDGTVMAWGGGGGTGTKEASDVPVPVAGLAGVTALAAGEKFSLALREDGTVESWGWNNAGELGRGPLMGPFEDIETPATIPGLEGVKSVSAAGATAAALLEDGTVKGWGNGQEESLGGEETLGGFSSPHAIAGLSGVTAIATGEHFNIAVLEDGAVKALGDAVRGNGGEWLKGAPTPVCGADGATLLAGSSGQETPGEGERAYAVAPINPLCMSITEVSHNYAQAGETVTVKGTNLNEASSLLFGAVPASFTLESNRQVKAVVPPGSGFAHVVVKSAAHESREGPQTLFAYSEPPMMGTCGPHEPTLFSDRSCTTAGSGPAFDIYGWSPVFTGNFETSAKTIKLETPSKVKIACTAETGTGEYTGPKSLGAVVLTLTGCSGMSAKCTSPGQAEGVIRTAPLEGLLGTVTQGAKPSESKLGLELAGLAPSRAFAEFSCGASSVVLRGGAIAAVVANVQPGTEKSLEKGKNPVMKFAEKKGAGTPRAFEGSPADPLEASINGGAFTSAGIKGNVSAPRIEFSSII